MERTVVNPWAWSVGLGFDQAHVVEGPRRLLLAGGQDSVDAQGRPLHPGDMGAQVALALDNVEAVLTGAGMTLRNVVRLNVYSTDVDELFTRWGSIADRFAAVEGRFVTSVLGVTRLAAPDLLVLLEATAVA